MNWNHGKESEEFEAKEPAASPFFIKALLIGLVVAACASASAQQRKIVAHEYAIKAALLARFLKFVEWPDDAFEEEGGHKVVVMVIGKDPADDFFDVHLKKKYNGRELVIKRHRRFKPDLNYTDCNLLFIAKSEKRHADEILEAVAGHSILTVGEFSDFLEYGGMINFVNIKNVINFDINQRASSEKEIRIRSDLLRRANHVIRKNT